MTGSPIPKSTPESVVRAADAYARQLCRDGQATVTAAEKRNAFKAEVQALVDRREPSHEALELDRANEELGLLTIQQRDEIHRLRNTLAGLLVFARGNQPVLDRIHAALDETAAFSTQEVRDA